jgi:hypothetical protein
MAVLKSTGNTEGRGPKVLVLIAWLLVALILAAHHAFWRDEVRAFSLAIQGDSVIDMLAGLHGEGHPALWYLLLRGVHFLVPSPRMLPVVAMLIAGGSVLLLALYAPFRWPLVALIAGSYFAVYEYAVMARNYGISMLLLFGLAVCYPRWRGRGLLPGLLLLLLASTNVHSVLLVGAFLLFWLVDLLAQDGLHWTPALRSYGANVVLAAAGIVACVATVYPPFNDAAVIARPDSPTWKLLAKTVLLPADSFFDLALKFPLAALTGDDQASAGPPNWLRWLMSLVMFGSTLGLIRSPGALLAALLSLVGFSLLFVFIYQGGYRHEALWLVFLITLYWITLARGDALRFRAPARLAPAVAVLSGTGWVMLVVLLAIQVPASVNAVADAARHAPPNSQSREFAAFLATQPQLKDALIVADPDYLVESLPYYLGNRTYLLREQRYGTLVKFRKQALVRLTLDDILEAARRLHAQSGQPLLILLRENLATADRGRVVKEGYNWTLVMAPDQVARFRDSTELLMHAIPVNQDQTADVENFDVYRLRTE